MRPRVPPRVTPPNVRAARTAPGLSVKFLCDRCKTRYSIGDDRVRGKILKIRCKNCANVITVREGMSDADASAPSDEPAVANGRVARPTTMAPKPAHTAQAPAPANGVKPPPALDEE